MGRHGNLVVIPCFNEQDTILHLANSCSKYDCDVLVIDDCSTDNSYEICVSNGINCLKNVTNIGYEHSIKRGLEFAVEKKYRYATTIDGDGEILPENLSLLVQFFQTDKIIFIGIRPQMNRISELVASFFTKLLHGVHDPICGFKCYKLNNNIKFDRIVTSIGMQPATSMFRTGGVQELIKIKKRIGTSRYGVGWKTELRITKAIWKLLKK